MLVNLTTGEEAPVRCGANFCDVCGPLKAWKLGLAITYAAPERFVRFSLVGETHQERRARIKRVVYRIRQRGYRWQHAYGIEANPRGTGHHAHLYQHGDFVPQDELQALCHREGLGQPHIERYEAREGQAATYGMKAALYAMKSAGEGESGLVEHLRLNGGRLLHTTRGFWRHGPGGGTIGGQRAAVTAALEALHGPRDEDAKWVLMAVAV